MIDYKRLFSETLCDLMETIFTEHGIESIYEDEFDDIVAECTKRCFWQTVREFRDTFGLSVLPKTHYNPSTWMWNRR